MSERAAQLIAEDILQYMGPVRVSDVETAQQKIVDIVRRLEDAGEIVIAGRGGRKGNGRLVVSGERHAGDQSKSSPRCRAHAVFAGGYRAAGTGDSGASAEQSLR